MTTPLTRRAAMRVGLAAVAAPAVWRNGRAADAIKIGAPIALTGPLGSVGQQMKRGCEFWAKWQNAKGGLLGRPVEMVFADTAGDPAACVRKAQEMVERDGIRILTAITLSSEALATVPKLAEWDTIFMSSDNGDGRLTAESFVPNFFRANISGPMGTRAVALWLRESKMQNFYAIGLDYAWGHNSIGVFESEVKKAKKNFVGAVYSPVGTKDYSTYITKIRQAGADACFIVMQGDDNNAFLSQSREYRLPDKVQLLTEIVDLASIRAVGDASLGLVGSSRYSFTIDNPSQQGIRRHVAEGAWQRPRHVRGRAVAGLPRARRRHREGRQHRGRQAAAGARDGDGRQHQGPCRDACMRPSGGAAGLHGTGGKERGASDSDPRGDRNLSRRAHHAAVQQADLRRLRRGSPPPLAGGGGEGDAPDRGTPSPNPLPQGEGEFLLDMQ